MQVCNDFQNYLNVLNKVKYIESGIPDKRFGPTKTWLASAN
jgi:hypothetical protein